MRLFILLVLSTALTAADFVWIEAESATNHSFNQHNWYTAYQREQLSNGALLGHFGDSAAAAQWQVQVPESGQWTLWIRANDTAAKMDWRLDRGPWQAIDWRQGRTDRVNLASDGAIDLRFLSWVRLGELDLKRGRHALAVRTASDNHFHGAVDCLVLTRVPFAPLGTRKPGEKSGLADPGTWAFEPDPDPLSPEALVDLRSLNESESGSHGFLEVDRSGDFVFEDGTPVRFWAVNTYVQANAGQQDLERHLQFLAKRGVNMVRFHGALEPKHPGARVTDIDEAQLDQCFRLVAAAKKAGVYVTVSPYWAHTQHLQRSWGIDGVAEGQPWGLLFFEPELQRGYRAWLEALMTRVNPYTKLALKDDPTCAIIQIQNEDSLLFWTAQNIPDAPRRRLGQLFGTWLSKKYGSLAKAFAAWQGDRHDDDHPAQGVVGWHIVWEYTQERQGGRDRRLTDQLQFTAELMRGFNADTIAFLRKLGCKQPVNPGNWRTASAERLGDVERWSYTAGKVLAANHYYGGIHQGDRNGYRIEVGHQFTGASVLTDPSAFPLNKRQPSGHAFLITEGQWVPPIYQQVEGPWLIATYGSMLGIDGYYWFSTGSNDWGTPFGKWQIETPVQLGQFPAAALLYRRGDLQVAKPSVVDNRSPNELWRRESAIPAEGAAFDPNRDRGDGSRRGGGNSAAFLVGPVQVTYGSGRDQSMDLRRHVDAERIRSQTGELRWHHRKAYAIVDAPRAAGAVGNLKAAGTVEAGPLVIDSSMDYAALLVVSLDDQELGRSDQVLVQIGTGARPHGFRTSPVRIQTEGGNVAGERIEDLGSAPWNVTRFSGSLSLKNNRLRTAILCDANFMPVKNCHSSVLQERCSSNCRQMRCMWCYGADGPQLAIWARVAKLTPWPTPVPIDLRYVNCAVVIASANTS